MKYSVAIVAIARLENPYINDWIKYHKELGFSHFYIYDNSCKNETHIENVLNQEYQGITTIVPAYDKDAYQKSAYNDAYTRFNGNHDYMLYIDIDEFFTLCKHKTISEYIDFLNSKCKGFQSCRINWEIYGDNDVIERDLNIPVYQFFKKPSNTHKSQKHNCSSKCLVKTKVLGMYFDHVHYSKVKGGKLITCNSAGMRIYPTNQRIQPRTVEYAKIRHYATKTISEFINQKMRRGDADGFLVRSLDNSFFIYCTRTQEKMEFYEKNKGLVAPLSDRSRGVKVKCKPTASSHQFIYK